MIRLLRDYVEVALCRPDNSRTIIRLFNAESIGKRKTQFSVTLITVSHGSLIIEDLRLFV